MPPKTVTMPPKPQSADASALDRWVKGTESSGQPQPVRLQARADSSQADNPKADSSKADTPEPTKRLTFDIPQSVHRRLMVQCAEQGTKMATILREMIEERFPAETGQ